MLRDFLRRLLAPRLPTEPPPATWAGILARRVPLSRHLTEPERVRLLKLTQLFVRHVPLEGCRGLQVTDDMRVTIGATACLLLLRQSYPRFIGLQRVLVYPETFMPRHLPSLHAMGQIAEQPLPELGEAWRDGIVVLSWGAIEQVSDDADHGRNVVLHEFAHVLDHEGGRGGGEPILDSAGASGRWNEVFRREFERECAAVQRDEPAILHPYAATNRSEFFAVATEEFFVTGAALRARAPELYDQLRLLYRMDPAAWR